jgi:flagellar basal body-associated protein FliL
MSEETLPAAGDAKPEKKKLPIVPILVVLGVIVMEGGTIGIMSMLSGPSKVQGVEPAAKKATFVEISLYSGRLPNSRTGKKVILDVEIYARVNKDFQKDVEATVTQHSAELADELASLVSKLDQRELYTVNSEVLRRGVHTLYEQKIQEDKGNDGVERIDRIFFKKYNPLEVGY